MKLKPLVITVAVLAVLALAARYFTRPPGVGRPDPRVGHPLLSQSVVGNAAGLRLTQDGKTVELLRQPDHTWRVKSYYDFPADFGKLADFVRSFTQGKVRRFVTARPERLARLDFKDTSVTLLDAAGQPLWVLTLGKTADTGGQFVRFGDEKKAYLAQWDGYLDTTAQDWVDAGLLAVKPADVAKIEISLPDSAPVIAQRAKPDAPFTAGAPAVQELNSALVSNLVSTLTALRFTGTTAPGSAEALAAAKHDRTLGLTTFAGVTYTIRLGRTPGRKELKAPEETAPAAAETRHAETAKAQAPAKTEAQSAPTPEYTTIPAGPVFAAITSSDEHAPINAMMQKRAFEVADYNFGGLPQARNDLFQALPPPEPKPPAAGEHPKP